MGHVPKYVIVKMSRVEYIYFFHARYLHNDIFWYVTRSHDITKCYPIVVLHKLITRVVIATGPGYKFSGFLQLPLL